MDSTRALLLTFHIVGIALWLAGLVGIGVVLSFRNGERDAGLRARLGELSRRIGRLADGGAALTLLFGACLLGTAPSYYLHQPWMHVKLTLVVLGMIGSHGFYRMKAKRASKAGNGDTFPSAAMLGTFLVFVAIVGLVVAKPLSH